MGRVARGGWRWRPPLSLSFTPFLLLLLLLLLLLVPFRLSAASPVADEHVDNNDVSVDAESDGAAASSVVLPSVVLSALSVSPSATVSLSSSLAASPSPISVAETHVEATESKSESATETEGGERGDAHGEHQKADEKEEEMLDEADKAALDGDSEHDPLPFEQWKETHRHSASKRAAAGQHPITQARDKKEGGRERRLGNV
jgi:hypothetical protein